MRWDSAPASCFWLLLTLPGARTGSTITTVGCLGPACLFSMNQFTSKCRPVLSCARPVALLTASLLNEKGVSADGQARASLAPTPYRSDVWRDQGGASPARTLYGIDGPLRFRSRVRAGLAPALASLLFLLSQRFLLMCESCHTVVWLSFCPFYWCVEA